MTADQADDRERIARALNVAGWTCSGGYHEPEQYDECAGCQKVCGEMADAVLAALDLPARDNAVARKALTHYESLLVGSAIGISGYNLDGATQLCIEAASVRAFRDRTYPTPEEGR